MFPRKSTWLAGGLAVTFVVVAFAGAADDKNETKPGAAAILKKGTPDEKTKVKAKTAEVTPEQKETPKATVAAKKPNAKAPEKGAKKQANNAEIEKAALAKLTPRPERKVTPPTIDSAAIDAALDMVLSEEKVNLANQTSDVEYVRRIYLDTTGKPPTAEQAIKFCNSNDKKKRSKLVETLLGTESFADNWARLFRDVISYRSPNTNPVQVGYGQFEGWLAQEFHKNTPWDQIVSEILTATGPFDENGAVAFTLAETNAPVEMAGEVSRIFMGIQIQCAQCHDHPNDPWKRRQFHEFAAFFQGIRSGRTTPQGQNPQIFEVTNPNGLVSYKMPDLKEPGKEIPVQAKFFLASSEESLPDKLTVKTRRELAASYVVGQDNPWFAKAFVNRVWASLMGEGFVSPIDDLGPTRDVHHGELFDRLSAEWQAGGYDIRWLFKTILNTRAYQRQVRSTNSAAGRTHFAANCSSRLRSDQIFDSLVQVLKLPEGQTERNRAIVAAQEKKAGLLATKSPDAKKAEQANPKKVAMNKGPNRRPFFNSVFGVDPSTAPDEVLGTIPQALFLMNDPLINTGITKKDGLVAEILNGTQNNQLALDLLYVHVLARKPTPAEFKVCDSYMKAVGNRREVFEDILWSLINSTEFLSRR